MTQNQGLEHEKCEAQNQNQNVKRKIGMLSTKSEC